MKKILVILLLSFCLFGCKNEVQLTDNLYIQSFDTDDKMELVYVDKDDLMFSIINSKVVAYKVCKNYVFIVQHPLTGSGKVDEQTTNYYMVDRKISDEKYVPKSLIREEFDKQIANNCDGGSLTYL